MSYSSVARDAANPTGAGICPKVNACLNVKRTLGHSMEFSAIASDLVCGTFLCGLRKAKTSAF